jgi:predicted N-acyltransferase
VTVAIHHDLAAIDPVAWDALSRRRGFYDCTPWLAHAHATADPAPWYVVATGQEGLLAALPAYPLTVNSPFVFCRTDVVLDDVHRARLGGPAGWTGALLPTLACGGRNPSHTGVGVRVGVEPGPVLAAVLDTTEVRARAAGLRSMAFLYVDDDDYALRAALVRAGFAAVPSETAYVLDVPAGNAFAGYLAGFRHGRRAAILREQRALAAAGVTYEVQPFTEDLVDRVAPLELALYARHGTDVDAGAFRAVLHSVARHCAGSAYALTASIDGRLAGFLLVFRWGDELYARQAGFDYAAVGRLPVYFGLVYYELIRLAGEWGVRRIHYSTGSGAVKASRGCQAVPQHAYVKAFDPDVHALVEKLEATPAAR